MPERTMIVAMMLTTARQIVASQEFARDAALYADIVQVRKDYEAASSLRTMVRMREAEIMVMRIFMSDLIAALTRMPVETG